MKKSKNLLLIIKELEADAQQIDQLQLNNVETAILQANRVFIDGAGRSGFAARAFANRLMHLGFQTFFVGEPTTPSLQKEDLLFIGSGSGKTASLVTKAKMAKKIGATLATATINPNGEIGSIADCTITIPGISAKGGSLKTITTQVLGSSFEQLSWLVYDSMIIDLKNKTNQSQEAMKYRHANLE